MGIECSRLTHTKRSSFDEEEGEEDEEESQDSGSHAKKASVFVNVYDIQTFNASLRRLGIGVYHTGVQVYDSEFSYAGHKGDWTGVRRSKPRDVSWMKHALFHETIYMGETSMTEPEVLEVYRGIRKEYKGNMYSPMQFNCNCFTRVFLRRIRVKRKLPPRISRLKGIAQKLEYLIPMEFKVPLHQHAQLTDGKATGTTSVEKESKR